MKYTYLKPDLENLSQGARIAYVRQLRRMTQDEVSSKLGLTGECKRRSMTRYERGDRIPKQERLEELARIFNVNVRYLEEYNFRKIEDTIFQLLWMDEMYPRMNIELNIDSYYPSTKNEKINKFINEWTEIKEKRLNHEITYEEYIEWKLQCEFKEGEKNNENS